MKTCSVRPMDYSELFSADTHNFMRSPVRDIFKKYDLSKLYSFAGGYPHPCTFPHDKLLSLVETVQKKYGTKVLQYGSTQGVAELLQALSQRYDVPVENIQITTSSQQGIDVTARVLLDPGDVVLVAIPSYLGALQSFKSYRAEIVGLDLTQSFEASKRRRDTLRSLVDAGKKIKFFYTVPDFQNPSGETLTLAQRSELVSLAREYGFLILEDSPYRDLRYEGKHQTSIYTLAPERTVHLGSFSKVFAPGLRLGWMIAASEFLDKVYVCKQSLDLCPPILDQYLATEWLTSGELDRNLEKSVKLYKGKRDLMLSMLEKYMPQGVSWTHPEGGLFLFLTLPESIDAVALYDRALAAGVAYVAGAFFYPDCSHHNTMRLSFSFIDDEKIEPGIKILASLLR